ncbi:hypothetical protein F5Y14DRAFT_461464 [Nemania sp. NC0429]|nr:hypothetical protein F5Y14DRAFT_461464 [Nemania sp. NC0429]
MNATRKDPAARHPFPYRTRGFRRGKRVSYFFIHIVDEGTQFTDIWAHLKKNVKRIEYVEIYNDCPEGWICLCGETALKRVLDAFKEPVLVQSTNVRRLITIADTNLDRPVEIRPPKIPSLHMNSVFNSRQILAKLKADGEPISSEGSCTSEGSDTYVLSSTYEPPQTDNSPVVAHETQIRRSDEPVIACGTYIPQTPRQIYGSPVIAPESWTSGPTTTVYENAAWRPPVLPYGNNTHNSAYGHDHNQWAGIHGSHMPMPMPMPMPIPMHMRQGGWGPPNMPFQAGPMMYNPQPMGPPPRPSQPPNRFVNLVTLSGVHPSVTFAQIRRLVERLAAQRDIDFANFRFMDWTARRLETRYAGDAVRLAYALDGRRLNGVEITASFVSRMLSR